MFTTITCCLPIANAIFPSWHPSTDPRASVRTAVSAPLPVDRPATDPRQPTARTVERINFFLLPSRIGHARPSTPPIASPAAANFFSQVETQQMIGSNASTLTRPQPSATLFPLPLHLFSTTKETSNSPPISEVFCSRKSPRSAQTFAATTHTLLNIRYLMSTCANSALFLTFYARAHRYMCRVSR